MPKLADHGASPRVADPDAVRAIAGLAVEIRGTVTPVIGYLELISEDASAPEYGLDSASAERQLQWIATIERRLEAMQQLNDQVSRICAVLRDQVNDRAEARPPAPGAPEG
jgi:hypothetical protein